jgi:hypothetical protein
MMTRRPHRVWVIAVGARVIRALRIYGEKNWRAGGSVGGVLLWRRKMVIGRMGREIRIGRGLCRGALIGDLDMTY